MDKLVPLESNPFVESLKATAGRLSADVDMMAHYCNVVRMAKDPAQEREYIIKIGATAHKMVRDVEEALKRPPQ